MQNFIIIAAFVLGTALAIPTERSLAPTTLLPTQEEVESFVDPGPAVSTTSEYESLPWKAMPSEELATAINYYSDKYGTDRELAFRIIECESGFEDRKGENGTKIGEDIGYWQINTHYHEVSALARGFDIHDLQQNLEYGFLLLSEGDPLKYWSASAYCWKGLTVEKTK